MNKKDQCMGSISAGKMVVLGGAILSAAAVAYFNSRRMKPKGVKAIKPFFKEKYMGKWYEIARLDFFFEKNLNNTTAEYSMNFDGSIRVVNRGYDVKENEWKKSVGKALFRGKENVAKLKVSFWGPFYSGYNVIATDPQYQYALVCGRNHKYLWILSRNKTIPAFVKENFLRKAHNNGFNIDKLIWVNHDN